MLSVISLSAQCIDKDSLWRRLVYIRDSSYSKPADFLSELLTNEETIKSCPYAIDSVHAFLLESIGTAYYRRGDFLKTIQYFLQGIDLNSKNSGRRSINVGHNIVYYYNLSFVYGSLNNIADKIKAIDSCVAIAVRSNSIDILCLSAMYKKIEYLFYIGDFQNCIDYSKMCEILAKEYAIRGKDEYATGITYILSSLGWRIAALIEMKNYETAEEILVRKIEEIKRRRVKDYLGTYLENLAEVEVHKGNFDRALLYFNQALASEQEVGHIMACKEILNNIGFFIYFNQLHDYNKSLFFYKKALDYTKGKTGPIPDRFESLNELANIANVYSHLGFFDSALQYFQFAFDQIKPGMNESSFPNGNPEEFMHEKKNYYLANLLINKGDAFIRQYKLTKDRNLILQAFLIYKTADKVLDRIKEDLTDLNSKLFWRSSSRRLYEHAIEAAYFEKNYKDAFYFFEKSKSVLLSDQLNQLAKISNQDIFKLAQLRKKNLKLERELDKMADSSKELKEMQAELFTNKQELDRLEQTIRQNSPLYYQSFLDTAFISLEDVQKEILRDHQALIEIFSGDSAVYSMLITRGRINILQIDKTDYDNTVDSCSYFLNNSTLLNREYRNYIKTASHLYQLIFKDNFVPVGRIIVSPDGPIFPFEALIVDGSTPSPGYFLSDHAVSYTFSARNLMTHFDNSQFETEANFLGVAPVRYSSGSSLAYLEGSDLSLSQIGSYFSHSSQLIAGNASRSNFQKEFSKYRIIQLYTHASDTSSNGEPAIYFADSTMYLSDLIPENRPQTRLIVLSACETGKGKLYQGEGVFSFNRGFASLGIPSSIANLWAVDNKTTYRITELFYKNLAKGLPIDVALQKAKLEFIHSATKENQLPYFWAATILTGNSDALINKKVFPWKDTLVVISMIGLVFVVWQKRKKINQAPDKAGTAS